MTLNPLIPPEAAGLGPPLGEYRRSWKIPLFAWGAIGLGALWFAGSAPGARWPVLVLALGALLAAVLHARAALRGRIVLCEQGLADLRRRRSRVYRWDRASALDVSVEGAQGFTFVQLELRSRDEAPLKLSAVFVVPPPPQTDPAMLPRLSILELMGAIAETVNPILIRRALAAYDAGETIDFGPLRLSIAGIQAKGRVLSWERVADIANPPNSTIIRVLETGGKRPWLAIQRANLDSAPVFYELLKHAHGETFSLVRDHAPADEPPEADQPFVRRTWRERLDKAGPWLALALMIVGMFGYRSYRSHYTAPGLIKQADALYRDGQPAEAMAAVEKAIQLDPNSVTAHIQRGSYRQQLRQFDLALADYDRALALDPASPAALLVRGKLHGELGNDAAARADLERYLELGDRYGKRAEVEELLGELDR